MAVRYVKRNMLGSYELLFKAGASSWFSTVTITDYEQFKPHDPDGKPVDARPAGFRDWHGWTLPSEAAIKTVA